MRHDQTCAPMGRVAPGLGRCRVPAPILRRLVRAGLVLLGLGIVAVLGAIRSHAAEVVAVSGSPGACHRYAWDYHRTTDQREFAAAAGLDRCAEYDDEAEAAADAREIQESR